MRILALTVLVALFTCSYSYAQEVGRDAPPFVEASVSMPTKFMNVGEKRCDMVHELGEKSQMNYRLLGMKIMEKWQASIKKDKTFLKTMMQYKTLTFTVKKDGTIDIQGSDEAVSQDSSAGTVNARKPVKLKQRR